MDDNVKVIDFSYPDNNTSCNDSIQSITYLKTDNALSNINNIQRKENNSLFKDDCNHKQVNKQ